MKTNVKLLIVISLLVSACTTGSMVTSSSYTDDAYFTPGDHPLLAAGSGINHQQKEKQSATITGLRQEDAGKIVDNYYSDKKDDNLQNDANTLNTDQSGAANTYEADEQARDFIENYDDSEDIDYTTRIRTFYNPYAYDPYWDSYYTPGFGFGWGLGLGFGFGGFYGGYYSPFYGWGGYYPYWGGYYGGYYPYWGGHHGGWGHHERYADNRNYYYGRQNQAGSRVSGTLGINGSGRGAVSSSYSGGRSISRTMSGTSGMTSRSSGLNTTGSANLSTRQAGTRYTVNPNITRSASINATGQQGTTSGSQTNLNLRRNQIVGQSGQVSRQSTTPNGAVRYTPTYSRPRTNIQATYNSGSARQYSRPQSYSTNTGSGRSTIINSYRSSSSPASASQPRSGGQVSGAVRSNSSSGSYSAPARSSSSFSSGGGGGRSFSGGGNSGGGGGGGGGRRH